MQLNADLKTENIGHCGRILITKHLLWIASIFVIKQARYNVYPYDFIETIFSVHMSSGFRLTHDWEYT